MAPENDHLSLALLMDQASYVFPAGEPGRLSLQSSSQLVTMLNWAITYQAILLGRWWWVLTPVVLSLLLFIALYWLSVSISEYLDPRTRIQRVGA